MHDECLQLHPAITDQKPHNTCDSKATQGAADGDCGTSIGINLEDGICSYCKCYDFNSSTRLAITSRSVLVFKIGCSV